MYRAQDKYYEMISGYCKSEGICPDYLVFDARRPRFKNNYIEKIKKILKIK